MTAVPALTIDTTGVTQPAETDILTGALTDIDTAFGGGLNTDTLTTPQGQLATGLAAIVADKNAQIANVVNQVDPANADGRFQDGIARIYFLTRKPALPTSVQVVCTGLSTTPIPVGAMVQGSDGTYYASTAAGVIGTTGTITLSFEAMTTGPIACPAGTISGSPYTSISGWDTAANVVDGVIGRNVESRSDFEYRRSQSVAANGKNSMDALRGALLSVDNVLDCYCYQNNGSTSITLQNVTLLPHSIYACVSGGAAQDIADTIYAKKNPGCDMNGNTTGTVQNTTDYDAPYPTYTMTWQTAIATPVYFVVTLVNDTNLPSNIATLVKAAIIAAFNGASSAVVGNVTYQVPTGATANARARIAATIYASRYYSSIAASSSFAAIQSVTVGPAASPTTTSWTPDLNMVPTISEANISVVLQ